MLERKGAGQCWQVDVLDRLTRRGDCDVAAGGHAGGQPSRQRDTLRQEQIKYV